MEENPPTPAGSDKPRSRTPRAAFSTPEQPTPPEKPADRAAKRAAKAPPPVTFQPPSAEETASGTPTESPGATPGERGSRPQPGRGRKAAPRKAGSSGATPQKRSGAAPDSPRPGGDRSGARAVPADDGPAGARPTKATPAKATPAEATPAKAGPEKTTPAKAVAAKSVPARSAPAKKAPAKKAAAKAAPATVAEAESTPNPAVLPETPPAKAAPATVAEAENTPATAEGGRAEAISAEGGRPEAATAESGRGEAATAESAGSGPVKATPPRAEGIAGAPAPADSAAVVKGPGPEHEAPATPSEPADPAAAKATPAKATPAKKAARKAAKAQPPAATPAQAEAAATHTSQAPAEGELVPPADAAPAISVAPLVASVRTEAWAKLVADPGHAPELLALAAVQTIGPRAQEWAQRTRESYPNASPESLARLAQEQFTRFGSVGSVFAAVAGSYAPVALLASNALTYAELVLHIAAAYGIDPTDEHRAADLLVLAGIHPGHDDAEAALAAARQPAYEDDTTLSAAVWRLGRMVAVQAGAWMAVRAVNRVLPGTALLTAVMTSRNGARTMAGKATAFYRAQRGEGDATAS